MWPLSSSVRTHRATTYPRESLYDRIAAWVPKSGDRAIVTNRSIHGSYQCKSPQTSANHLMRAQVAPTISSRRPWGECVAGLCACGDDLNRAAPGGLIDSKLLDGFAGLGRVAVTAEVRAAAVGPGLELIGRHRVGGGRTWPRWQNPTRRVSSGC